jgi:hypothetical protein
MASVTHQGAVIYTVYSYETCVVYLEYVEVSPSVSKNALQRWCVPSVHIIFQISVFYFSFRLGPMQHNLCSVSHFTRPYYMPCVSHPLIFNHSYGLRETQLVNGTSMGCFHPPKHLLQVFLRVL